MSPLADAVSFVDGQQLDFDFADRSHEGIAAKSFGGDVDQFVLPGGHPGQAILLLVRRKRTVDKRRGDIDRVEGVDLIFHQRDQRRDDDRDAGSGDCGKLETEALAAASGHDAERVSTGNDGVNDLALPGPKPRQPEIRKPIFRIECFVGHSTGRGSCRIETRIIAQFMLSRSRSLRNPKIRSNRIHCLHV